MKRTGVPGTVAESGRKPAVVGTCGPASQHKWWDTEGVVSRKLDWLRRARERWLCLHVGGNAVRLLRWVLREHGLTLTQSEPSGVTTMPKICTASSDRETDRQNLGADGCSEAPTVAITMGDPAGIGPELVVKVLASYPRLDVPARILVIGDLMVMRHAQGLVGADLQFQPIVDPSEAAFSWPVIDVLCPEGVQVERVPWGRVDAGMGRAAALCLQAAAGLAEAGAISGITSAPLNKESFHGAGFAYRDELAFLADLTGSTEPFIAGVVDQMWTITVTEHIPFRDIAPAIKKERVLARIKLLHGAMRRAGVVDPRIGVAALNVHGGDGGLFGREEIDEIGPAIEEAQRCAIDARGPVPADAIFLNAFAGDFDGVVCMYHDQANIARKLQPREKGATLFLGLPVMCATTAHGTAFDIAGRGIANAGGLETALRWTCRLAAADQAAASSISNGGTSK